MGAWGTGAFQNDAAADWVLAFQDGDARLATLVKRALARIAKVKAGKRLDLDDSVEAVAAAEVVATARGHAGPKLPAAVRKSIVNAAYAPDDAVSKMAARAVERIATNSELRDEWAGDKEWRRAISDLAERLKRVRIVATRPRSGKPPRSNRLRPEDLTPKQAERALGMRIAWSGRNECGDPTAAMPNATLNERDLELLARIPTLTGLGLHGRRIKSISLDRFRHLKLQWLGLTETAVDDDVADFLSGMPGITELRLTRSRITDAIVPHLCRMTRLRSLDVSETAVTRAGAERLKRDLPACRVIWLE
jgi:hypothetical protein